MMEGDEGVGGAVEGAEVGEAAGVKAAPAHLMTSIKLSSSSRFATFSRLLSSASTVGQQLVPHLLHMLCTSAFIFGHATELLLLVSIVSVKADKCLPIRRGSLVKHDIISDSLACDRTCTWIHCHASSVTLSSCTLYCA